VKSAIIKRSVVIAGHKTSVSLEQPFWDVICEVADAEQTTVSAVLRRVDGARQHANLSSAVRMFALEHVQARVRAQAAMLPAPIAVSAVPAWREASAL
jgi:predicted DNA-binding ribbon-helix-helix protein